GAVVVAVDDVGRDVADFDHAGGGSAAGDGTEGGKDIGMVHGDAPGAVAAHGVAHEVDARGIHAVGALHIGHRVEDILLRGAAVHGSGVAAFGADHEEADAPGQIGRASCRERV